MHEERCTAADGGALHCRLRDLNDEINKLIREKGHWERRIVELGGPDYAKSAPKVIWAAHGKDLRACHNVGTWLLGKLLGSSIVHGCSMHSLT